MTITSTIKILMRYNRVTLNQMAKMLNLSGVNSVQARLRGKNMSCRCMFEMLDVLGYEMVVRSKHSVCRRDDEIIITMEDEVKI